MQDIYKSSLTFPEELHIDASPAQCFCVVYAQQQL